MSLQNTPSRYLELLKKSLINELYIENEAKIFYLVDCIYNKKPVHSALLVEPEKVAKGALIAMIRQAKSEGLTVAMQVPDGKGGVRVAHPLRNFLEFPHSMIGRKRMDNLHACIESVLADQIPGDLIETGVWRGGATILMRGVLAAHGVTDRTVWVADSFEGLPAAQRVQDSGIDLTKNAFPVLAVTLAKVQELFARYDLLDEQVRFLPGWFCDTLPVAPIDHLAILRLDGDLYASTMDALTALYDKVSVGGYIIVDDYYALKVCQQAVDDFRQQRGITDQVVVIDSAAIYWRKQSP